jgi:hypothetical protein
MVVSERSCPYKLNFARHVASVHEGLKEVVGVDGYIGHIYEGG